MSALLLHILAALPRGLLQRLGVLTGIANHRLNTIAAKVTRVNLGLCGQDPDLSQKSLIETGKTLMETPAVWLGDPDRIDRWITRVEGESLLEEAIKEDRGLLMLLPHIGNWELFNIFYARYGKMTAMYQPPRRASLNRLLLDVRRRRGNEMVPADRRGLTRLFKALNEGATVVILPDQVPTSGSYVPFLGQQALTDELGVRLLQRTGARALGIFILRNAEGRFDVVIREPDPDIYSADMPTAMASMNQLIESGINLAPAQYQWEYKRFKARPAGAKKVYRFNKPPGVHG